MLSKEGKTMRNLFNLPDVDVFDITPLESMDDLLIPETSLCVFHKPIWDENGAWDCSISEASRIIGISNSGEKEILYVHKAYNHDLGRHKSKLDKHLLSAYLFVSWRKHWGHTFKMFQQHELIAEFPDFDSAIEAYLPDGFTPRHYYRFAHTIRELYYRSVRRRLTLLDLLRLLHQRVEKLSI
jgi:hypothetical protein